MSHISVRDPKGVVHQVNQLTTQIIRNAILFFNFPLADGKYVHISRRKTKCLEENSHEPRCWIVYTVGSSISNPGQSIPVCISFHKTRGGPKGAIVQAGLLVGQFSEE